MSWWSLAPALLASACLAVVPGTVLLRLLGVRGLYAWAGGPAVTAALLGAGAALLSLLGIAWTLPAVAGLVLAVWLVGALAGLLVRRTGFAWSEGPPSLASAATVGAVGASALFLAWTMKAGMGAPDALLQQWDGVFHLNAVATVQETGDASSFGGLAPMYGDGSRAVYYPAVWHSLVAVVPWASVPAAANASTLVLGAGVWSLGLAGFARAVFPSRPVVHVVAPLLGAAFITFPSWTLSTSGQWPNGYSVALLPGACALVVLALRAGQSRAQHVVGLVVAGVGALGAVLAHGSAIFALAALLTALLVGRAAELFLSTWRRGRRATAIVTVVAGAAVVAVGAGLAVRSGAFDSVLNYDRPGRMSTSEAWRTTLLGFPPADRPLLNGAVLALVVAGIVATLVLREGRWLVVSLVVVMSLVVLAAGPENGLRWLSGFWYRSHVRVSALLPIPAALLGALGAAALARVAGRAVESRARSGSPGRARAVPVVVAAVAVVVVAATTSGLRLAEKRDSFAAAYQPGVIAWGTMVTPEEREMLDRMDEILPPDSVVLGEALTGAAFAYALAGVPVVYPQIGGAGSSEDQAYLREHFRDVASDPAVCEIVRRLGITHFYAEPPAQVQGTNMGARSPGLFDVDTSTGFEQVASVGPTTVYRITACAAGEVGAS